MLRCSIRTHFGWGNHEGHLIDFNSQKYIHNYFILLHARSSLEDIHLFYDTSLDINLPYHYLIILIIFTLHNLRYNDFIVEQNV